MKETQDLLNKKYKPLKTETKKNIRRWKELPYLWIGIINIVKMAILPKAVSKFQ
jgi:hypothetical protein